MSRMIPSARGWVSAETQEVPLQLLPDPSAHVRQNHACALATHQAKFAPSQLLPRFACEVLASLLPKWQCCACVVLYFPAAILPLCCSQGDHPVTTQGRTFRGLLAVRQR